MATIDVGAGATDRSSYKTITDDTWITIDNSANDNGFLTVFEIFAYSGSDLTNTVIGTFSGSSPFTSRDSETIGAVTSGSKQTFTGKNCTVSNGDYLGLYANTGKIEADGTGFAGAYSYSGNAFDGVQHSYSAFGGDAISIYATGSTDAPPTGSLPTHLFQKPFRHMLIR